MSSERASAYSEPGYATSKTGKNSLPWYLPSIDKNLVPETRQLLETYSKVPPEKLSYHVHEIREKAWAIRSYPCTGLGVWLVPMISRSPAYPTILQRLKGGSAFMDVGCFLGHDLRRLVFDGAPSTNLYGVDIVSHWEVGYDLFRDRERFSAHFIEADILSEQSALLALRGQVDIISITHVFHQWDWEGQVVAAKKVCEFTRAGSMVVGCQIGNVEAKDVVSKTIQAPQWRHNPASFQRLWDQVGAETGTEWKCQAWLRSWEDMGWDPKDQAWMEDGARVIDFVVTRSSR